MKQYITIDIGNSHIRYGIIGEDGVFLQHNRMLMPGDSAQDIILTVLSLIEELRDACDPEGVCLSTVGLVDPARGVVFYAPEHLAHYAGTDWKRLVESGCSLPCEVERAVNCAALAEYTAGTAADASSFLYLTLGADIDGCVMQEGTPRRGHSLSALSIGYLPLYGSTFETLASTGALTRKVAAIKGMLGLRWDVRRIFYEAEGGDRECIQAIEDLCDVVGRGIATICLIVNPEIIVLGGELMTWHRYLMPLIRSATEKYIIDPVITASPIASASCGEEAAMRGALLHYQRVHQP